MTNRNTKTVCKFKISRELVLVIGWRSYWRWWSILEERDGAGEGSRTKYHRG